MNRNVFDFPSHPLLLICFGTAQRILEVSPDGTVRWDLTILDAQRYAYRAIAVETLY